MAVTPFQLTEPFSMDSFNSRVSEINTMFGGLGNEYVWTKESPSIKKTLHSGGNVIKLTSFSTASENVTISYADEVEIVDGQVALKNPQTVSVSYDNAISSYETFFQGKYVETQYGEDGSGGIYYISASAKLTRGNSNTEYYSYFTSAYTVAVVSGGTIIGYVNSSDPNAYPPAVSDGYTYTPLGQLGAKVQIATGSYTGTGTYGSSNPNTISLPGTPILLVIGSDFLYANGSMKNITHATYGLSVIDTGDSRIVSWYSSNSADYQGNVSGRTYKYTALIC